MKVLAASLGISTVGVLSWAALRLFTSDDSSPIPHEQNIRQAGTPGEHENRKLREQLAKLEDRLLALESAPAPPKEEVPLAPAHDSGVEDEPNDQGDDMARRLERREKLFENTEKQLAAEQPDPSWTRSVAEDLKAFSLNPQFAGLVFDPPHCGETLCSASMRYSDVEDFDRFLAQAGAHPPFQEAHMRIRKFRDEGRSVVHFSRRGQSLNAP
jgi:hypothetical protein